jgi:hypothetical protein
MDDEPNVSNKLYTVQDAISLASTKCHNHVVHLDCLDTWRLRRSDLVSLGEMCDIADLIVSDSLIREELNQMK